MAAVLADPSLYEYTGGEAPSGEQLRRRYSAQAVRQSEDGSQGWFNWILRQLGSGTQVAFHRTTRSGPRRMAGCRLTVMGKRRRRQRKITTGDGRPLKPFRLWHVIERSLFYLDLDEGQGSVRRYAVDVDHFGDGWDATAQLYRDGRQELRAPLPNAFTVPGGEIVVEATFYGLKKMQYEPHHGKPETLRPDRLSSEGLRARFGRRYPRLSRIIGWAAIAVLLASLVLAIPQLLQLISQVDIVSQYFGTFSSPFTLSAEANTALAVAGVLAATERALTLRNHWLIDLETGWFGD